MLRLLRLSVLLSALALAGLDAQEPPRPADPLAEADRLYRDGRPGDAFERLHVIMVADPADTATLWRLLRAAAVASFFAEESREENGFLDTALYFAEPTLVEAPRDRALTYWRGVVAGRRALKAGARNAVRFSQIAYDDARWLLATDSTDAAAHNLLGKVAFEIMSLSRWQRAAARVFVGGPVLGAVSWELALRHLTEAVRREPASVLYRYDLAALYLERGWRAEAVEQLREALRMPDAQPVDPVIRRMATELLVREEGRLPERGRVTRASGPTVR